MRKKFLLLGLLFFVVACTPSKNIDGNITARLQDKFDLHVEQKAFIEGQNLQIMPVNVLQDSRCPVNVQCIVAGQIDVELKVILNGETSIQKVSNIYNQPLVLNGYMVRLLEAKPERKARLPMKETLETDTIDVSDYVFTFEVLKT